MYPQDLARFMSFVEKQNNPPFCWLWKGAKLKDGYGEFKINNCNITASRAAYEHFNGYIPLNYLILHTCDNPSCVNPAHLYPGTPKHNMEDCQNRGRFPNSKLNNKKVKEIKEALKNEKWGTSAALARKYGVTRCIIANIKTGKAWRNVK